MSEAHYGSRIFEKLVPSRLVVRLPLLGVTELSWIIGWSNSASKYMEELGPLSGMPNYQ